MGHRIVSTELSVCLWLLQSAAPSSGWWWLGQCLFHSCKPSGLFSQDSGRPVRQWEQTRPLQIKARLKVSLGHILLAKAGDRPGLSQGEERWSRPFTEDGTSHDEAARASRGMRH